MKSLFLVRHAKSSWDDARLSDFDRPLNERGEKDAPRMGELLKKRGTEPDLIYSSPALRALTTAKIIGGVLGYPENKIQTDRQLYHSDEERLLTFLRNIPDSNNGIMLFGHNPGLTEFANELFKESIGNIPTAGIVTGQLIINSWKEAKPGCGKLLFFDFPKNLKRD